MIVEKNDVDISQIFHWGKEHKVMDKYGNEIATMYIRVVGDAEINRARIKAIRASRDLREKLKDKDSDERMAFIPDVEDVIESNLINAILMLRISDFTQAAMKSAVVPIPAEPKSDASLELQEKYQVEIDDYPQRRQELIKDAVTKMVEAEEIVLKKLSKKELVTEYERYLVVQLCETEMANKFRDWCTYFGCYKDEEFKVRYFNEFEDFTNLPTEIKAQLVDAYGNLDLNIEYLKKSLEVTP